MIDLTDYTTRTVGLGTATIGAVSGALGCFAYLRRQSLVGDVVSHASLLGIMIAFLVSYWVTGEGSKSLFVLVPGALLAGIASLFLTRTITNRTRIKEDCGLGVMLAIFFGTGLLLLRWVQRQKTVIPGRRGLDDYLFGMAAAMGQDDLVMIAILGISSIALMILFWKEFKVFTFDPVFAHSMGMRTGLFDSLLLTIMVMGIVIGIQAVGVVLMIALIVAPAGAARQWCRHLGPMVALAALIGASSGVVGSMISSSFSNLPTGPVIVLCVTSIFLVSLIFAPRRGLISRAILRQRTVSSLEASGANTP